MATYRTPGVYVQEIATLPPSVAEVSTAIPAFIGCTAIGPTKEDNKIVPIVKRINTMLDYEMHFGGAYPSQFNVTTQLAPDNKTKVLGQLTRTVPSYEYRLYDSLNLYFNNGGGACYVVSIGNYDAPPEKGHFEAGLMALAKEDEPTLLLLTDAVGLKNAIDYYGLCQRALQQCKDLADRFTIVDVLESTAQADDAVGSFRTNIGNEALLYGAAYYPYLATTLTYAYQETSVTIDNDLHQIDLGNGQGIRVSYRGDASDNPKVKVVNGTGDTPVAFVIADKTLTITLKTAADAPTSQAIAGAWKQWPNQQGFAITVLGDGSEKLTVMADAGTLPLQSATLATIKSTDTALYNQIKSALNEQRIKLPPSPAIAGVYASVDRERGVWKAPANVSLASVIGPVTKITDADQADLNIDSTTGKSINAIRAFTGKGTLVWGARTLAGNHNEWRYVSVRRLFNLIEESTKKASAFAVFEPNDATTWLKVKAMIESYLYGLWQQGALAGPTPEAAYFVNVGLGKTMQDDDIQNGRLIVKIGIAAVRPAEFIILSFMHKLQQA